LEWVVVDQSALKEQTGESVDSWVQKTGGAVVDRELIDYQASQKPAKWCVVRFQ
jgi:hypothetical protein